MRLFKNYSFLLMILLIASCTSNNAIDETPAINDQLSGRPFLGDGNPNPPASTVDIYVHYGETLSLEERQQIRAHYATQFSSRAFYVCPSDYDTEIWTVNYITLLQFDSIFANGTFTYPTGSIDEIEVEEEYAASSCPGCSPANSMSFVDVKYIYNTNCN